MAEEENDGAWFRPKSFGYGAGLPLRWQGWALLLGHIVIIVGFSWWAAQHRMLDSDWPQQLAYVAGIIIIALVPMPLYAAKTRGGWKWRSGKQWGD